MMDSSLIDYLYCPLSKAKLRYEGNSLLCSRCGVEFRIENDIPLLIIENAKLPEGVVSIAGLECQKKD